MAKKLSEAQKIENQKRIDAIVKDFYSKEDKVAQQERWNKVAQFWSEHDENGERFDGEKEE